MKQGIHPENYRPVVFKDMSNGDMFLSRSTCKTTETVEFEGETYPVVKLEISSTSHPFYTGKSKLVDTAGRVDKFMSRYFPSPGSTYRCLSVLLTQTGDNSDRKVTQVMKWMRQNGVSTFFVSYPLHQPISLSPTAVAAAPLQPHSPPP